MQSGHLCLQIFGRRVRATLPLQPSPRTYPVPLDNLDEDTTPGGTCAEPDKIGTVSVQVFLVENWQRRGADEPRKYRIKDHPPAAVDERAKKVGGHCVS